MVVAFDSWRCLQCGTIFARHLGMCAACFTYGSLAPIGTRPRAQIDGEASVATARELRRTSWKRVVPNAYPDLALGAKSLVLVSGPAGSGKSSLACRLVSSLEGQPPVCLYSAEEGLGPALSARLTRLRIAGEKFFVCGRGTTVDSLVGLVRKERCVAVVIDSVQEAVWAAADLRQMLSVVRELDLLVAVSQVNVDGLPAGQPSALRHEADVHITCADVRWQLAKSRFQPLPCGGPVLASTEDHANAE